MKDRRKNGKKEEWNESNQFHLSKFLNLGPLETTLTLQMHQEGIFVHGKYYRLHLNSLREFYQPSDISVLHGEIDGQFSGIHFKVSNDLLCARS